MSKTLEDIDNLIQDQVDTPSNVTILDMTEDCTRLVFDRLTLNQLIHLRAVCHAWNDIITDICEKKSILQLSLSEDLTFNYFNQALCTSVQDDIRFQFTKKTCLEISIKNKGPDSSEALKRTRDGSLSDQQNDPNQGIRFLAQLFPNITNFVAIFYYDRLYELNYILWKWSTNLDTLTIFVPILPHYQIFENTLQDTSQCFEQMCSLKRLHLFVNNERFFSPNGITTFGQLEEFSFDSTLLDLTPYFAQLNATNCKLALIGDHSEFSPSNIVDTNPELTSNLTHLSIYFYFDQPNHISQHIAKFQNLIYLEIIYILYCSMAEVLNEVVQLKKLETLVLHTEVFEDLSEALNYADNPNYPKTFPIFLNTVSELHIKDNCYTSHFGQVCLHDYQMMARAFPRVRIIRIYSNNLNKATFDAQFRPRFSETFGGRVEVIFYRVQKYGNYHFSSGK